MQRTDRILKGHRSGFALIMAIFVVLIIGMIMVLMVNITATSTQRTTNNYLHEQARFLAKSATEYAMLAISGHNRAANNNCITTINAQYPDNTPIFNITINMQYIGFANIGPGGCNDYVNNGINASGIFTNESIGSVLMDVTVSSTGNILGEPIRYHRRTLQKL